MTDNIATHDVPAWRSRANFIIRADLSDHGLPGRLEQLWARKIDDMIFEICCIPFFTYGIALGDQVECDSEHTVQSVVEKAGHKTLRIAVADMNKRSQLHCSLHEWVENTGLLYEWYDPGYLAVDMPPDSQEQIDLSPLDPWSKAEAICIEVDE